MNKNAKLKERRKNNAARMREVRAERKVSGQCRTCEEPVGASKRTGKPARQCEGCLDKDAARKRIYVLPVQSIEAAKRRKFVLEYPVHG